MQSGGSPVRQDVGRTPTKAPEASPGTWKKIDFRASPRSLAPARSTFRRAKPPTALGRSPCRAPTATDIFRVIASEVGGQPAADVPMPRGARSRLDFSQPAPGSTGFSKENQRPSGPQFESTGLEGVLASKPSSSCSARMQIASCSVLQPIPECETAHCVSNPGQRQGWTSRSIPECETAHCASNPGQRQGWASHSIPECATAPCASNPGQLQGWASHTIPECETAHRASNPEQLQGRAIHNPLDTQPGSWPRQSQPQTSATESRGQGYPADSTQPGKGVARSRDNTGRPCSAPEARGPSRAPGRSGGNVNFVRSNGGKVKNSYQPKWKATRGGAGRGGRFGKGRRFEMQRMARESLPVAGLGADNIQATSTVCFNCGQKGHWASECKSHSAMSNTVDLEWCVSDPQALKTDAPPLPAVLCPEAAAAIPHAMSLCTSKPTAAAAGAAAATAAAAAACASPTVSTHTAAAAAAALAVPATGEAAAADLPPAALLKNNTEAPASSPAALPAGEVMVAEGSGAAHGAEDAALLSILESKFGFPSFKEFQLPVVKALLQGQSCLVVQPTGAGKSICFQLPTFLLPGLVLVVSPLTAHIRDAVQKVPKSLPAGICLGGEFKRASVATLEAAARGRLKLLLVTPECLSLSWVRTQLEAVDVSLVCVDEAHCAAETSGAVRPACLRLPQVLRTVSATAPRLLLTATASPETREELCGRFQVPWRTTWVADPVRPEVETHVLHVRGAAGDAASYAAVLRALQPGGLLTGCTCTLIYCAFRAHAEQVAGYLQGRGVPAMTYHAGMQVRQRQEVADALAQRRVRAVACTIALTSGLDLSCVDGIVHFMMPSSMEDYTQQIGRAGRRGQPATALLFLRDHDFLTLHSLKHTLGVDASGVRRMLNLLLDEPAPSGGRGGKPAAKPTRKSTACSAELQTRGGTAGEGPVADAAGRGVKRTRRQLSKSVGGGGGTGGCDEAVKTKRVRNRGEEDSKLTAAAVANADSCTPADDEGDERAVTGSAELEAHRPASRLRKRAASAPSTAAQHMRTSPDRGQARCDDSDSDPAVESAAESSTDDDDGGGSFAMSDDGSSGTDRGSRKRRASARPRPVRRAPRTASGRSRSCAAHGAAGVPGSGGGDGLSDAAAGCGPAVRRAESGLDRLRIKKSNDLAVAADTTLDAVRLLMSILAEPSGQHHSDTAQAQPGLAAPQCQPSNPSPLGAPSESAAAQGLPRVPQDGYTPDGTHAGGGDHPILQQQQQQPADTVVPVRARGAQLPATPALVLFNPSMTAFKVGAYKRPACELAEGDAVMAAVLATARTVGGLLHADMQKVVAAVGMPPDAVQDRLQRLAGLGEVHVERVGGDGEAVGLLGLQRECCRAVADAATARLNRLRDVAIEKLETTYSIMRLAATWPLRSQRQVVQAATRSCFSSTHSQQGGPAASWSVHSWMEGLQGSGGAPLAQQSAASSAVAALPADCTPRPLQPAALALAGEPDSAAPPVPAGSGSEAVQASARSQQVGQQDAAATAMPAGGASEASRAPEPGPRDRQPAVAAAVAVPAGSGSEASQAPVAACEQSANGAGKRAAVACGSGAGAQKATVPMPCSQQVASNSVVPSCSGADGSEAPEHGPCGQQPAAMTAAAIPSDGGTGASHAPAPAREPAIASPPSSAIGGGGGGAEAAQPRELSMCGTGPLGEPAAALPFQPASTSKAMQLIIQGTVEEVRARLGPGQHLTARAVARILHGRDSPGFERKAWASCRGWGKAVTSNFAEVMKIAQAYILSSL